MPTRLLEESSGARKRAARLPRAAARPVIVIRNAGELAEGAIVGALHIRLAQLPRLLARWLVNSRACGGWDRLSTQA